MIKIISLIMFTGMVVMNYLANALPIGGKTTGQISAEYPNLFVPAGITFSIWGVIYLLLAVYSVLQFFPGRIRDVPEAAGWLFSVSCLLNGMWILAWHYERLPLSVIIMTGLLVSLILINFLIRNIPFGITKAAFGIYLGWICIATIANITALLISINWNGLWISGEIWTLIMITAGALIVIPSLVKLNNPFIGLAAIWAFSGIVIRQHADYRLIAGFALAMIIAVGVFTGLVFFSTQFSFAGSRV